MPETWTDEALHAALRRLAGQIAVPPAAADLPERVVARVAGEPAPRRAPMRARAAVGLRRFGRMLRRRAVWATAVMTGVLLSLAVVTPVGATIAEWFGFHGVIVDRDSGQQEPTGTPSVPPADGRLTMAQAAALVSFTPRLPATLGEPDGVELSRARSVLSVSWGTGAATVRLDQFDGRLAPAFHKAAPDSQLVDVGGAEGLWFPTPHPVTVLDPSGSEVILPPRLAAQTLIWEDGGITFRLEGPFPRDSAVELAESVR